MRLVAFIVVVQELFESFDNSFVWLLAGDELPVIEPDAIVEEQYDVGYDQPLAMFIDGMLQLVLDL